MLRLSERGSLSSASLALALLLAAGEARAEAVLVTAFEPHTPALSELASSWPEQLARRLRQEPGLMVRIPEETPDVEYLAAAVYMQSCPPGAFDGCAHVVAQNAGIPWAITGSLEPRGDRVGLSLHMVSVEDSARSYSLHLELDEADWPVLEGLLVQVFEEVRQGRLGIARDIRQRPGQTPRFDDLEALVLAAEAEATHAELERASARVQALELDEPAADRAGRAGDLLFDLSVGGSWGATDLAYAGDVLYGADAIEPVATRGAVGTEDRLSPQLLLGIGLGLGPSWDLELRAGLMRGSWQAGVRTAYEGGDAVREPVERRQRFTGLQAELLLQHRLFEQARISPVIEAGAGLWRLKVPGHLQEDLASQLTRFDAFSWGMGRLGLGLSHRPGQAFDLQLTVPLTLLVGVHAWSAASGETDHLPAPTAGESLSVATGLELRFRPRIASTRPEHAGGQP